MKPIRNWSTKALARMRGRWADRGATSIEYAGIVILVAGIIIAIRALNLDTLISGAISNWVGQVLGG
ncbi:hypothetical protein AN216_05855 [Streptomyces oceani]|uniref:Uncharacterized protein n=2 Tax=Streptomyces oceani TaxID=1075402 RepID=A0A1E7KLW5_9ACTN|nr:hypothetical protein [Streptomyces oceani]OEV04811.1 hypothetical protein AN216_05855 [Streptomyces oceani]